MTLAIFIQSILAFTVCVTGLLFVFLYDKKHIRTYTLLLIHLLSILLWALCILIVLRTENIFIAQGAFVSALILAVSKYYFILTFPKDAPPISRWQYIPLIPVMFLLIIATDIGAFFNSLTVIDGVYIESGNGPYRLYYVLTVIYFLLAPIYFLQKKLRTPDYSAYVYTQIRFLLIGVSFFFVIGLITNSVLPAIFDVYFFNGIGPSFSLILAGFIVYIISRHHFLNISSYVQRGFIYLLLSIFVVCSYLGILAAANELFKFTSNINTEFITIVTCLVGIFTVPHLNSFLKRKTDRFFFKDKYQYETVLLELSELLNMSISLHEIQTKTTHILKLALRAEAVHIRLGTSQLQPAPYITELFTVQSVPLQTDGEHQGELLVAQKCSGDAYTKVDIQLLETVSRQLSVSLQRAMLHKKIEEYNHELEEKVWDRTAELRNAHRNQYDLITDISHGLQTPLTIVQSELEHLKRGASKPQRFQTFEKSISDLSVFIYDLLKLAQMESPSDTVQLTTCDLSGLLIDIAAYAGPPALDKNIFLNAQVQPEVYIYAHSKKIEEVVLALLGNAMKYIGSYTDKSIEIGLTKNATHAEIRVTDSGIGIPTEHSSNIFTRFYRVKDRRMSNVAGTGLGLSLVQAIVKKHNGNIRVESIVEVGTTFIVTLPLIPCPDA